MAITILPVEPFVTAIKVYTNKTEFSCMNVSQHDFDLNKESLSHNKGYMLNYNSRCCEHSVSLGPISMTEAETIFSIAALHKALFLQMRACV